LKFADEGGELSGAGMAFVEDEDVLVDSGESGLLGREVELIAPDGQSNNNIWQQLARKGLAY
jgi:branched-chain amino acid transport system substrate-binding protein